MKLRALTVAAVALSVGYTAQINPEAFQSGSKNVSPVSFKVGDANAQTAELNQTRRVTRRTSRRVNRRQNIADCSPYNGYYDCAGVYYRAVVEDGKTVYVVVNK
ncbi:hypothetical protein PsAD2_01522 [Pseudovibrio axinellae]|uniref:Uncharacterized protein n=1 Tax=Pseudovibrio axinellae TaxID=989403 RepID=A0A165ZSC6_9HYPH|nr:hypothetical protein [Pseudovibrio axinellae]KZL20226.1 hypothetical protein PsAD2_01522 [Pseudovibrio axinellae]SEQ61748.1 hypothetical protein SAMN05421798_103243 [Pseudovibrio axinellae]